MREVFEVPELVRVAVEDERTGVGFYSALAKAAKTAEFKTLWSGLADQEKYHLERFGKMLDEMGEHAPKEQYSGEYMSYLQTLTETRAFPDEQTAVRMAGQCASDAEALDLASRFERDTLVLLNEMRAMVGPKDKAVVDEITREEQAHLVTLAEARRNLKG